MQDRMRWRQNQQGEDNAGSYKNSAVERIGHGSIVDHGFCNRASLGANNDTNTVAAPHTASGRRLLPEHQLRPCCRRACAPKPGSRLCKWFQSEHGLLQRFRDHQSASAEPELLRGHRELSLIDADPTGQLQSVAPAPARSRNPESSTRVAPPVPARSRLINSRGKS